MEGVQKSFPLPSVEHRIRHVEKSLSTAIEPSVGCVQCDELLGISLEPPCDEERQNYRYGGLKGLPKMEKAATQFLYDNAQFSAINPETGDEPERDEGAAIIVS